MAWKSRVLSDFSPFAEVQKKAQEELDYVVCPSFTRLGRRTQSAIYPRLRQGEYALDANGQGFPHALLQDDE